MIVYFDMDGVFTDFEESLRKESGYTRTELRERGEYEEVMYKVTPNGMFRHMTPSPHIEDMKQVARRFKDAGWDCQILTSYGPWDKKHGVISHENKVAWLYDYIEDFDDIFSKFNGVPDCLDKGKYGRSDSFLIDDQKGNVEAFKRNGGRAIQYSFDKHPVFLKQISYILED